MVRPVKYLLAQINQFIKGQDGTAAGSPDVAVLGNIARLDDPGTTQPLDNQIIATIVNIQEESTLRNGPTAFRDSGGGITYRHRPVYLNIYVLFAALYRDYETSLRRLEQIVAYFQMQSRITSGNAQPSGKEDDPEFVLSPEMVSLTFEQVNYLWAPLGGKQLPFILYKIRVVSIDANIPRGSGPEITDELLDSRESAL